jgi:hypothetical protein
MRERELKRQQRFKTQPNKAIKPSQISSQTVHILVRLPTVRHQGSAIQWLNHLFGSYRQLRKIGQLSGLCRPDGPMPSSARALAIKLQLPECLFNVHCVVCHCHALPSSGEIAVQCANAALTVAWRGDYSVDRRRQVGQIGSGTRHGGPLGGAGLNYTLCPDPHVKNPQPVSKNQKPKNLRRCSKRVLL